MGYLTAAAGPASSDAAARSGDPATPIDTSPGAWEGGPDGVLVLHGFTGSPHGVRPWAESLAAAGYAVELPLLPGHGTSAEDLAGRGWREWTEAVDAAYWRLRGRADRIGVAGLSMGGALALHLAARRPVAAVSLVNPGVVSPTPLLSVARLLAAAVPTVGGVGDDISIPGRREGAYERTPVRAAGELHRLFRAARRTLPAVTAPVQIFKSLVDHVVPQDSLDHLVRRLGRAPEVLELRESFHVATLDRDAPLIFENSLRFFSHEGLRAGDPESPGR